MKGPLVVLLLAGTLLVALAPDAALADPRRDPRGREPAVVPATRPRPFVLDHHPGRHPDRRPRFPHVVSPGLVIYAPSPVVSTPPPVVSAPPPIYYYPAPVATPLPTVIEHPTGRYELRGDGVATPYNWVWIPKPPPPPPFEAPAPPPEPPAAAPPEPPEPRAPVELYRWVDERGAANWTDRLDNVPERYRAQVTR